MVYSALQIITRGRDNGVSVVELGQRSKYDQKTCFYLVRQLTELDLVYVSFFLRTTRAYVFSSVSRFAEEGSVPIFVYIGTFSIAVRPGRRYATKRVTQQHR